MKLYLFVAAYSTVLFAELLGDKSLLTISTLATRFRPSPLLCGISVAFMGKVLVAVSLGRTIAELPPTLVAATTAATFFMTALVIWLKKPKGQQLKLTRSRSVSEASLISFAAIFFSEWGDVGQITAATLSARYEAPLIVWLGASSALITKGILAITLGVNLQKFVSHDALRRAAFCLCLIMGMLAALGIRS